MVCGQCQEANPESSRFCGKCGNDLRRGAQIVPRVSGPSFLGLSESSESDSLSYLLEDEPRRSHGPILLLLALLTVAAGLGYLYWQNVYASSAYSSPPSAHIQPPPAFAYESTSPLALANTQLAISISNQSLPEREDDPIVLERIAAQMKQFAADDAKPKENDYLVEGEKYLYGRGVLQNCKLAVRNLQAAAKEDNAAALTHLGLMSASGHCMKLDRIAAYKWFTRAKQSDPANPWLDRSLDMLWASMTRRERNAVLR
jgi:hypothetical protein